MATVLTLRPFEIDVAEILPGIVITRLMFVADRGIKAVLIEKTKSNAKTVAVVIGSCLKANRQTEQHSQYLLHIYSSSNNT